MIKFLLWFGILGVVLVSCQDGMQPDTVSKPDRKWWRDTIRQVHYLPDGADFILKNGRRRFNLARQKEEIGTSLFSRGYISRNPNNNTRAHHYDMNLVFIDQLLNHFQWTEEQIKMDFHPAEILEIRDPQKILENPSFSEGKLTAVAMMCAGWDGSEGENPGFPKDGTWKVRWEGLSKMP